MTKQKQLLDDGYSDDFEAFWQIVWKKLGKQDAWLAWQKQRIEGNPVLMKIVINDVEKRDRLNAWHPNPQMRPRPAVYLNGRRWDDDWEAELEEQRKYGSRDAVANIGPAPARELTGAELRRLEIIESMDQYDMRGNRFLLAYVVRRFLRGRPLSDADLAPGSLLLQYKARAVVKMREIVNEERAIGGDGIADLEVHFATVMRDNFDRILESSQP